MGTPGGLGLVCIEVLRGRHITPGPVPFHFTQDSPHVVFRVTEVHQLTLIRCFEDCVADVLSVGQQPQSTLALG